MIRLKVPLGTVLFDDLVYGKVETRNSHIDDVVLIKTNGFPTYHFANVVDDHSMQITTVMRGQVQVLKLILDIVGRNGYLQLQFTFYSIAHLIGNLLDLLTFRCS